MLKGFFGKISGLDELARRCTATREPQGTELTRQTVQIGAVRYKRCVTVHVDADGLFLQIKFIFCKSRPPFFIPWQAMTNPQVVRLYWQKAIRLTIGHPPVTTITLPTTIYSVIAPHLSSTSS